MAKEATTVANEAMQSARAPSMEKRRLEVEENNLAIEKEETLGPFDGTDQSTSSLIKVHII
jgi:hypothetical protein